MATQTIDIVARDKTQRALGGIERSLGRIAGLAAGAFGVATLGRYANSIQTITNRLKLVTNGQNDLNATFTNLTNLANRSRQDLDAVSDLYQKIALSTKDLGLNQAQVSRTTETFSKLLSIAGAESGTAAGAIRQFAQALGSGAFRGDEFNSVVEAAPQILDILAAETGKARGEIRALAADGKLTADVLINSLLKASADVDQQFNKTSATLGQSLSVLQNNFLALGRTASPIFDGLSSAILLLADNLETATVFTGTFIASLAVGKVVSMTVAAGGLAAAIRGITAAMMANPFGLLAVAIAGAVTAIYNFLKPLRDVEVSLSTKLLYALEKFANATVGVFLGLGQSAIEFGKVFTESILMALKLENPAKAFEGFGTRLKQSFIDGYNRDPFKFVSEEDAVLIEIALNNTKTGVNQVENAFGTLGSNAKADIEGITKELNKLTESLETDVEQAYRKYEENLNAINEAEKNNVQSSISYGVLRLRNEEQLNEALQNIVQSNVDNYERAENEKTKKTEEETRKRLELERGLGSIYGKIGDVGGLGQYDPLKAQYEEELKLLEEAKIRENQTEEEFEKRKAALKEYYRKLEQDKEKEHRNKLVQAILTGTASIPQLEEAMGKDRVKIAGQVGMELLNMAAQHNEKAFKMAKAINIALATADAITSTISAFKEGTKAGGPVLGFIYAGVVAAAQAAKIAQLKSVSYTGPRERGGPVGAGQSYLVGEAGPEIFTPNAGGTILPNDFQKEKPTQVIVEPKQETVNVNFSITTVDAQSFDNLLVQRRATITGIINNALNKRGRMGVT